MATDDQSLATLVEAWIVTTILALEDGSLTSRNVAVFPGTVNPAGDAMIDELAGQVSPRVVVLFEGDRRIPLAEGQARYEGIYGIYIIVKNERRAAARRGDGTAIGTNKIRDILRAALHDKAPDKSAGGYHTELTEWHGVRPQRQRADLSILRAELIVAESPTAA